MDVEHKQSRPLPSSLASRLEEPTVLGWEIDDARTQGKSRMAHARAVDPAVFFWRRQVSWHPPSSCSSSCFFSLS
jgi:hypothetical protein